MTATCAGDLVSVVTPFHNTAAYLRECVESVLGQTYGDFEYILHDNASTDGSSEIAREYAAIDRRIRLIRTDALVPQVPNYNRALAYISPESRYCKLVQADDWLFPECVERMVAVMAANPRIGLVSSLRFDGEAVKGGALPYNEVVLDGRAVARFHLMGQGFLFGTPSTVLYRSDIVRSRRPFYEENRFQEDTEACYEILKAWDFGFVHQILSYSRVEPDSLFQRLVQRDSVPLGRLILTHRYGPFFLSQAEFDKRWRLTRAGYYRHLAKALYEFRANREYWRFHGKELASEGLALDAKPLAWALALEATEILGNPKQTLRRLVRAVFGR